MAHGVPDTTYGEWFKVLTPFVVAIFIIVGFVWVRYYSPCSWWTGASLMDAPIRCLDVGRKP